MEGLAFIRSFSCAENWGAFTNVPLSRAKIRSSNHIGPLFRDYNPADCYWMISTYIISQSRFQYTTNTLMHRHDIPRSFPSFTNTRYILLNAIHSPFDNQSGWPLNNGPHKRKLKTTFGAYILNVIVTVIVLFMDKIPRSKYFRCCSTFLVIAFIQLIVEA